MRVVSHPEAKQELEAAIGVGSKQFKKEYRGA
jgi:hypothetical protein